jgi:hypothetical protein
MDSIQPVRAPLSAQPPQRIDSDTQNRKNNNCNAGNAGDISLAYKRRPLKHRIECGVAVSIDSEEISELALILGDRQCEMYRDGLASIASCVVCDDQVINGLFAVETVLFIPNKNDPKYDNLGRFRIELPRVACYECSHEHAAVNAINIAQQIPIAKPALSLGKIWQNYKNGDLQLNEKSNKSAAEISPVIVGHACDDKEEVDEKVENEKHGQTNDAKVAKVDNNNNNNVNKSVMPLSEAERDPFDDGFLICTQLVKTGGADQGGLQVGDVFVEFGHYSKTRFPGLKSIANLVRRSAGKEINVVVWRKLEQMNAIEDDGTGRTVFQKLALKLKPLQSHDADGGGVLGAVINTYPLPEMKN